MDIAATLKNPYILIGGVGLGLLILVSKGAGSAPTDDASISARLNNSGFYAVSLQAQNAITSQQIDASTKTTADALSYLATMAGLRAQTQVQMATIQAGIEDRRAINMNQFFQTQLASLLGTTQVYQAADVANKQTRAQVQIAAYQMQAAEYVAKKQAQAATTSSIVGGITSVAGGILKLL